MSKSTLPILRFGAPGLREVANKVTFKEPELKHQISQLKATLQKFQSEHGWGRSMAAPQIGINKRLIAINTPGLPGLLINPEITWHSEQIRQTWDDCMSFSEVAVMVERWQSISVKFHTLDGEEILLEKLPFNHAELLQHEIDHLDGILMTDRLISPAQIIDRAYAFPEPRTAD